MREKQRNKQTKKRKKSNQRTKRKKIPKNKTMGSMTKKDSAKKGCARVRKASRAMNNHQDINPETKEMIMRVIEESNYVPNNSARNLKRSDAKAIAVLVKGSGNTFFS